MDKVNYLKSIKNSRVLYSAMLVFMFSIMNSVAQLSITTSSPYTDALTGYLGTNTFPTNWVAQGSAVYNGTAQTTGTTGGWYGNNNISFLGSGSAASSYATWRLQNNTGSAITGFTLSFAARMWKTGTASPNVSVTWVNNTSATNPAAGALTNALSSLTFNDATANISTGTTLSQTVSGLTIANGDYIYIRFNHAGGSSSDNLGWDDVTFTANYCTPPSTPTTPTAASNPACNSTTLNTLTPSAGETWYWQGTSSSGTSTANPTSSTYPVSTSGTYYVRAQNTSTSCWSTSSASVAVTINTAPTLTTTAATYASASSASSGGNISATGGSAITVSGICWSTTNPPTTADNVTTDGPTATGTYTSIATGLSLATTYYIRAYATNACGTAYGAVQTYIYNPCTEPTAQPTSLILTPTSSTNIDGSFTASGSANGYIIIRSTSSTLSAGPVDGTTYSAGNSIGGGTVVGTPGASTTFSNGGLTSGTLYYYFVYAYNSGACGINYLTSTPALTSNAYTFCAQPSGNPTGFSLTSSSTTQIDGSYTTAATANGTIVIMSTSSTLSSQPVDGTTYAIGNSIGGGTVVQVGTAATYSATGLTPGTLYYFFAIAYNSGSCGINYNTTNSTQSSYTQCSEPTAQPTVLTLTSASTTSITGSFTAAGSANGYIIIRSLSSTLSSNPVDGTTYSAGNSIGGGTVVQVGTGTTFTASGLSANTQYYFFVYSYNSSANCIINYLTSVSALTGNQYTFSNLSDVVAVAASEAVTISSANNAASPLTSSSGTQVWQITVRDGGASMNDNDVLPTIVNAFTITQVSNTVSNWLQAIKTIELFDGTTNVGIATVTSTQIQFTGLNISVPDNSSKTLSLRMSLNCGIGASNSDGDRFGFSLSNANLTLASSGSQKTAFSAAQSSNTKNVIDVTATQLSFVAQPATTAVNQPMTTVTVKATDACGNTDAGFTGTISLTSTGTMTGSPITATAVAGVATFSSITHTVVGTGYTLTAASTGLTSGTSSLFNIILATVFNPGDFAIVAVNTQVLSSGSTDEICFVTFEDIAPGTTFDITDNGYERASAGLWGNTEGVFRFTRSSSATTIPKGTVICINGPYGADDGDANGMGRYDLFICGVKDDANWTGATQGATSVTNFDLNSTDQVWIFQGGTWSDGAGSATGTHSGIAMYGWTATGWKSNIGSTAPTWTTSGSRMYPNMTCFTTDVAATTNNSKVKYTGPMTATTRLGWISRINTPANWTGYATNTAYDTPVGPYDYNLINPGTSCSDVTFNISTAVETDGMWTGSKNTDWFECGNWLTLKVPDSTINVIVDNVPNDPLIGASPTLFPNGAICNNLSITSISGSGILTLNNSLSYLSIKGNIINNGIITASNGLTDLRSANAQNFSGTGTTGFYNLRLNNTNSLGVSLSQDVSVANVLTFTNGMLSTGTNKLIITNPVVPTISGYTSSKFINGNLRHYIGSNTYTYIFPIGDGMAPANYKRIDLINNNLTGVNYIDASVSAITESVPNDDATFAGAGQSQSNSALWYIMENAQWDLSPDATPTGNSYGVRLYTANTGLSAADDNSFCPVKRPSASTTYADWVSLQSTTTIPASGAAGRIYNSGNGYAERLGYTSFSKHAIAKSTGPLPIELLTFTATYNGISAVDLKWVTATETNNDYFTIERSTDAAKFIPILRVSGAGNSSVILNYSDVDKNPNKGINYYRLKQTDFNGHTSYSPIVSVNVQSAFSASIYPNPATSELNIKISTGLKEQASFEIISLQGVSLNKTTVQVEEDGLFSVDLKPYAAGAYILRMTIGNETKQTLFIKQ